MTITDQFYNCSDCSNCLINDVCAASKFVKKTVIIVKDDKQLSLF